MIAYKPPSPQALQELKGALGFTGKQMAELAGLAGDQTWRKYTGGASPREMDLHTAFFMAARLVLTGSALRAVAEEMRRIGVEVDMDAVCVPPSFISDSGS
jgi:hypothetical protein